MQKAKALAYSGIAITLLSLGALLYKLSSERKPKEGLSLGEFNVRGIDIQPVQDTLFINGEPKYFIKRNPAGDLEAIVLRDRWAVSPDGKVEVLGKTFLHRTEECGWETPNYPITKKGQ